MDENQFQFLGISDQSLGAISIKLNWSVNTFNPGKCYYAKKTRFTSLHRWSTLSMRRCLLP